MNSIINDTAYCNKKAYYQRDKSSNHYGQQRTNKGATGVTRITIVRNKHHANGTYANNHKNETDKHNTTNVGPSLFHFFIPIECCDGAHGHIHRDTVPQRNRDRYKR